MAASSLVGLKYMGRFSWRLGSFGAVFRAGAIEVLCVILLVLSRCGMIGVLLSDTRVWLVCMHFKDVVTLAAYPEAASTQARPRGGKGGPVRVPVRAILCSKTRMTGIPGYGVLEWVALLDEGSLFLHNKVCVSSVLKGLPTGEPYNKNRSRFGRTHFKQNVLGMRVRPRLLEPYTTDCDSAYRQSQVAVVDFNSGSITKL